MRTKKLISFLAASSIALSSFSLPFIQAAADETTYSCDFSMFVKNASDTEYGSESDIYQIDEYTKAVLTYPGTYASADAKIYLTGAKPTNGNNSYSNGSYIAFTAPSDGTVTMSGSKIGFYLDDSYNGYRNENQLEIQEGQTLYGGSRGSDTYISEISFTASDSAVSTPSPAPLLPYTAPSTTWTFDEGGPSAEGNNAPVISGSASYSQKHKNIKFDANTTQSGQLSMDFDPAIKNNICVEFDMNVAALGGQTFSYSLSDSENYNLVSCSFNVYDGIASIIAGDKTIAENQDVTHAIPNTRGDGMDAETTHFKNEIDFTAGTVLVTIGTTEFAGTLTGAETGDISSITMQSSRSKKADRSIYLDNLTVSEFESTAPTPSPSPEPIRNNIHILQTYTDNDHIGVTITDGFRGTAAAALYNGDGTMEQLHIVSDNSKAQTIKFQKPADISGYTIKLFGWDMTAQTPLDLSQSINPEDIKTPVSDTSDSFEYAVYSSDEYSYSMPYRYYLPANYDSEQKYPILMYLHGESRNGNDNNGQMYNAQYIFNELLNEENISKYPCILIAPQCPDNDSWTNNDGPTEASQMAMNIINDIQLRFSADSDRIYLAGYSDGAQGCYALAEQNPGIFAAVMPIAGEKYEPAVRSLAEENTAVMAFHGSADTITSSSESMDMISALVKAGSANAEYCEFYGADHQIQEQTAKSPGVFEWLFGKSLSTNHEKTDKTVDLAIFMGQSNMAGRGEYEDAAICPPGHGYEFRAVSAPTLLCNITGPFGKIENNDAVNDNGSNGIDRRSGDLVSSLMESYYSETGVPIVGVQCSRGGTNLSYWNSQAQKAEAQARLLSAKTYLEENGYTINHIFMVWCQGEADADRIHSGSENISYYKENTLKVFEYMQDVGVQDMFIVQTGHYNGSDDTDGTHDEAYIEVHDAQQELADEHSNIYTVGSLLEYKEHMKDSYHFHQTAYNEVGTAAGAAIADAYAE